MKKLLTALVVGGMLLSGCGTGSGRRSNSNVYKDYYVAGTDYETLNYLASYKAQDFRVTTQFVDGLTENNAYGQTTSSLATHWEHNEDFTVWTFYLREGVKWVDWQGNEVAEVTADDFVYALEYVLTPKYASNNVTMFSVIEGANEYYEAATAYENGETTVAPDFSKVGIKAVDDYTVEYTTSESVPYFISLTLYAAYSPANREFVESLPATSELSGPERFGTNKETLLYNGPWLFTEDEKDSARLYTKNPTYWDIDNVHFDTVEVIAVRDQDVAYTFFDEGDLSYAPVSLTQYKANPSDERLVQVRPGKYGFQVLLNAQASYSEDTKKAIANENFRKSFMHAFDVDAYNSFTNPMDPSQIATRSYIINGLITAPDGTDYTELGSLANLPRRGNYDISKALEYKELALAELSSTTTFPIVINYWVRSGNEVSMQIAETVKDFMETNLGSDYIRFDIKEWSNSSTQEFVQPKLYGMVISGWGADYADPINILETMKTDGVMNTTYTGFDMTEYDKLVEIADAERTDIQKRFELFAEAEAYLYEHAYLIPVQQGDGSTAIRVTRVNEFERPWSLSGTAQFKIKLFTVNTDVITTEEYNAAEATWTAKRTEAMKVSEYVMEK